MTLRDPENRGRCTWEGEAPTEPAFSTRLARRLALPISQVHLVRTRCGSALMLPVSAFHRNIELRGGCENLSVPAGGPFFNEGHTHERRQPSVSPRGPTRRHAQTE